MIKQTSPLTTDISSRRSLTADHHPLYRQLRHNPAATILDRHELDRRERQRRREMEEQDPERWDGMS